jgi:hypothetical protein
MTISERILMSQSKQKKKKEQRFLAEHPRCYFCGGLRQAITIDHVPPKACFPDEHVPEGFWSPACKECNQGASREDQIFGFYSMHLDFDESKIKREENAKKLQTLRQGIINNYPDALPNLGTAVPVHQIGSIITPYPAAITLDTNPAFKEAIKVMGQKLTHALYMRETGKILTAGHRFLSSCYQPQRGGTETLTSYFNSLLPTEIVGVRPNSKTYGDRFRYLFGYKEEDDFFVYSAQFGQGLIVWGIVLAPGTKTPAVEPLRSAPWQTGACGAGPNA